MADEAHEIRRIHWAECFRFLHLFKAFKLAINPTKLGLAFAALLSLYLVGRVLDLVWAKSAQPVVVSMGGTSISELSLFTSLNGKTDEVRKQSAELAKGANAKPMGVFALVLEQSRVITNRLTRASMSGDVSGIIDTVIYAGQLKLWILRMHLLFAILFSAASLGIWALFGGAIVRVSALEIARDEKIGPSEALRFSREKIASFFFAPLLPVALILIGLSVLWLVGLVCVIPVVGHAAQLLVCLFFGLALLVGFVLALTAIGAVAGGWLMHPTIAVEGSDGFDAISRSYHYVLGRPWRTGLYLLVSMVYGAICLTFVKILVRLLLVLVAAGLGTMNYRHVGPAGKEVGALEALWHAPAMEIGSTTFYGSFPEADYGKWAGACRWLVACWVYGLATLVGAFAVSFAYSSFTMIYFLLRRDVDATEFDDVYLDEPTPPAGPAPTAPVPVTTAGGTTSLPIVGQP